MFWFAFFWFCAGAVFTGLIILLALCLMIAAARAEEKEEELRTNYGP